MTVLAKPSPCHSWYAMKSYRAAAAQTNFLSLIYIAILIVCLLLAYLSLFVSFFTYLLCLLFLCFCLIFIVHLSLRIEHLRFDLFNQSMFLFPHNSSSSKAFFFFLLGYFICLILSQLTSLSLCRSFYDFHLWNFLFCKTVTTGCANNNLCATYE